MRNTQNEIIWHVWNQMKQRKLSQNGGVFQITCQVTFSFLWFVFMFLQFHFFLSLLNLSSFFNHFILFHHFYRSESFIISFLILSSFLFVVNNTSSKRCNQKENKKNIKMKFNLKQLKIIIEKMKEKRTVKEKEGGVNDNLSGYFILLFLLYSFSFHWRYFSHISFIWLSSVEVLFWCVYFWVWYCLNTISLTSFVVDFYCLMSTENHGKYFSSSIKNQPSNWNCHEIKRIEWQNKMYFTV